MRNGRQGQAIDRSGAYETERSDAQMAMKQAAALVQAALDQTDDDEIDRDTVCTALMSSALDVLKRGMEDEARLRRERIVEQLEIAR